MMLWWQRTIALVGYLKKKEPSFTMTIYTILKYKKIRSIACTPTSWGKIEMKGGIRRTRGLVWRPMTWGQRPTRTSNGRLGGSESGPTTDSIGHMWSDKGDTIVQDWDKKIMAVDFGKFTKTTGILRGDLENTKNLLGQKKFENLTYFHLFPKKSRRTPFIFIGVYNLSKFGSFHSPGFS